MGTWQAKNIVMPQSGICMLRVTATPERGEPIMLDARVEIER
jgi:hypothetical protein